jgi:hypothetical protein
MHCGAVQMTRQCAGMEPMTPSSSTSTASPNHTQHRQMGTSGPDPSGARILDSSPAGSGSSPMTGVCSNSDPGRGQPPEAGVPGPQGERNPRVSASPGRRAGDKVRECAQCKITAGLLEASGNSKLKDCSGCKTVRYCGKACQKAHWPAHKATCRRMQAAQR